MRYSPLQRSLVSALLFPTALLGGCFVHVDEGATAEGSSFSEDYGPCTPGGDCQFGECRMLNVTYEDAVVVNGFCTSACASDADCPSGGICTSGASSERICHQACSQDADCIKGFACVSDDLGHSSACVPQGGSLPGPHRLAR